MVASVIGWDRPSASSVQYVFHGEPTPRLILAYPLLQSLLVLQHLGDLATMYCHLDLFLDCMGGLTQLLVYPSELGLYLRVEIARATHDSVIDGVDYPERVGLDVVEKLILFTGIAENLLGFFEADETGDMAAGFFFLVVRFRLRSALLAVVVIQF